VSLRAARVEAPAHEVAPRTTRAPRRGSTPGSALFVAFLFLLATAWVFANPPGYAPDEPAHYTTAVGVAARRIAR